MKAIIGLGNPGKKYQQTRHNIGFAVLDKLAEEFKVVFTEEKKFTAESATTNFSGTKLFLAKPLTFMNNSGTAVKKILDFFRLNNNNLLIIQDEIDLPLKTLRISKDSSSAGHNGVNSIINQIGQNFTRLRIGVDNRDTTRPIETENYVLQKFTKEEEETLQNKIIPEVILEVKKWLEKK